MDRALYQIYRPKSFDEVVGQPQVVNVLEKTIKKKQVGNAYLFSGARGTGKTSVARIFAREIGTDDIDIFEIDAASHTSVEHIREINTSVYTLPTKSPYKVYILDEAHMLSKSAFNAFLKTLEEPPAYAVFILATTEPHKIPDTVLSRCMSLSFVRPTLAILQDTLVRVAKKEKYTLSKQGAALLSILADSSFRDGLSLLQRVLLIAKDEEITRDFIEEAIGAPKHSMVNSYLKALGSGEIEKGIEVLDKAVAENTDMIVFSKLVIRKLRAALLLQEGVALAQQEYDEDDQKVIQEISALPYTKLEALEELIQAHKTIPQSYMKQLPLEIVLLRVKEG